MRSHDLAQSDEVEDSRELFIGIRPDSSEDPVIANSDGSRPTITMGLTGES